MNWIPSRTQLIESFETPLLNLQVADPAGPASSGSRLGLLLTLSQALREAQLEAAIAVSRLPGGTLSITSRGLFGDQPAILAEEFIYRLREFCQLAIDEAGFTFRRHTDRLACLQSELLTEFIEAHSEAGDLSSEYWDTLRRVAVAFYRFDWLLRMASDQRTIVEESLSPTSQLIPLIRETERVLESCKSAIGEIHEFGFPIGLDLAALESTDSRLWMVVHQLKHAALQPEATSMGEAITPPDQIEPLLKSVLVEVFRAGQNGICSIELGRKVAGSKIDANSAKGRANQWKRRLRDEHRYELVSIPRPGNPRGRLWRLDLDDIPPGYSVRLAELASLSNSAIA